ncbi:ATP-NAD kinase family protein [Microbacterium sp.]|uniref:ATP-NAD kinase family protein n=1 Tax=Microbacterium sp. TaxID=51671 RepID=UPI002811D583|nr:NAD(+)/NADH kinase [Microbacterium sp.]
MIGLVVNPVAGVGGPAGLAGSDGADVQRRAQARGARSRVQERTAATLGVLAQRHPGLVVVTAAGAMGADAVRAAGLTPSVVHAAAALTVTTGADASRAVAAVAAAGATLILVAGGDGTLRDAAAGLGAAAFTTQEESAVPAADGLDRGLPASSLLSCEHRPAVLGIPCGVKMYSPVFAVSPRAAGALAADWVAEGGLPTADREVLDVDEAAMRRARVDPQLFGMLRVPYRVGRTQARKAATPASEAAAVAAAARGVVAAMQSGVRYLLGPGGTTAEIARQLGLEKSPLGVDVVLDGAIVRREASESELLAEVGAGPAQAVVTVIGGQGFLLGRGNQQLSAAVLRALGDDPLIAVAPEQKLLDLAGRPLLVDTGDPDLDARLAGHIRVITGTASTSLYAVAAPETLPI